MLFLCGIIKEKADSMSGLSAVTKYYQPINPYADGADTPET